MVTAAVEAIVLPGNDIDAILQFSERNSEDRSAAASINDCYSASRSILVGARWFLFQADSSGDEVRGHLCHAKCSLSC